MREATSSFLSDPLNRPSTIAPAPPAPRASIADPERDYGPGWAVSKRGGSAVAAQHLHHAVDGQGLRAAERAGDGGGPEQRVVDGLLRGFQGGLEQRGDSFRGQQYARAGRGLAVTRARL